MAECPHHELVSQHIKDGSAFRDMVVKHEVEIENIKTTLSGWRSSMLQLVILVIGLIITVVASLCNTFYWAGRLDSNVAKLTTTIERHIETKNTP